MSFDVNPLRNTVVGFGTRFLYYNALLKERVYILKIPRETLSLWGNIMFRLGYLDVVLSWHYFASATLCHVL